MAEITEEKFKEFQKIEQGKIPHWATRTFVNFSNGRLTYEEILEITSNYNLYQQKYGK